MKISVVYKTTHTSKSTNIYNRSFNGAFMFYILLISYGTLFDIKDIKIKFVDVKYIDMEDVKIKVIGVKDINKIIDVKGMKINYLCEKLYGKE